jgi:hypothetical protein
MKHSGARYDSVQNLLSSRLLSKNVKITFKNFVLYGCEIWFLILKREQSLRVFENGLLRECMELRLPEAGENGQ